MGIWKQFAALKVQAAIVLAFASTVSLAMLAPSPAFAQTRGQAQVDVPAGRLSSSIRTLARQTGLSIATSDSGVRRVQARAVRGRMSPGEALRRLLEGTPYRAVAIRGGYRIERRPPPRRQSAPSATIAAPAPPPPPPPQPIIVEGTKRAFSAADYPGGVKLVRLDAFGSQTAGESLDEVLADVPAVNGTALGSGRNKVFLRGIADSSFNGPTQATIGLYLGEQRLIYSAPNPDLRLYDVETVELLEGPQGTLYGAGTIAGLLRVNPNSPDPTGIEAKGWARLGTTSGAGESWEIGAVGNLPIGQDAAVRFLGYGGEDSGYIDDPSRGISNLNRENHYGGRGAFAWDVGPDWHVELTGFGQHTEHRDGQYIDASLPGLARTDPVEQPFMGRIYGGNLTVRGYLNDAELVSTTGFADHHLRTTFDSSTLTDDMSLQTFREAREIRLISHETRLSGGDTSSLSWLVGLGALSNRDDMSQLIVNLNGADPPPFARLTYRLDEIAAFGEASYSFAPDWSLTAGARVLYTSASGERSFGDDVVVEPREGPARLLPALALSYSPSSDWVTYARYQQGFRTGGVTIERNGNRDPSTTTFDPDRVQSYEAGFRGQFGETSPLQFAATVYHTSWRDIQADLLNQEGFPLTRNIGDGTVTGVDANATLHLPEGWNLQIAGAWNDTKVDRILPEGQIMKVQFPNVPDFSAYGEISKRWSAGESDEFGLSLSGRYIGRSFLDIDQQVRIEQGDFGSLDAAAWWTSEHVGLRLEVLNLTDTRGNRFAFGNPFTVRLEDQVTPLRPLTVQLQVSLRR